MSTVVTRTGQPALGTYAPAKGGASLDGVRIPGTAHRIQSIDIIRGAVMVLMAIDHVRVFSGVPAGGPTPGVFFTRWVTHFCAPAFLFLAGTAAFLHGEKLRSKGALSRFLLTRGAWLVVLELTLLRFGWTFNFDYGNYMLAGVIWVIGWCMILMAGLVHLPLRVLGALGVAIIAGHNLLDPVRQQIGQAAQANGLAWLWQLVYAGGTIRLGGEEGTRLAVLYAVVPWIGVMAAGHAFGPVMRLDAERRRKLCLWIGGGAIAAFLLLRGFNIYGEPRPWGAAASAPAYIQFLNTTKYPASLLFLLMTLGPTIALIPLLEKARGVVANVLTVFGRVPFFYYVLHIPLIHLLFVLLSLARYGEVIPWLTVNHPMFVPPPPPGYTYGLAALYAITALAVALLYVPCRWFARLKSRRNDAWLSYL